HTCAGTSTPCRSQSAHLHSERKVAVMAKKKTTSTPPSVRTSTGSPALIGSLIALGLFLLLPMAQWIENLRTFDPPEVITQELPPPPPPLELDQEEEEEVEEEEIEELEPPPPPPSLEMLELALS